MEEFMHQTSSKGQVELYSSSENFKNNPHLQQTSKKSCCYIQIKDHWIKNA